MKRSHILMLVCSFLCSGVALLLVLSRMAPYDETGWLAVVLFFVSLFVCTASLFALLGVGMRKLLWREQMYFFHVILSLRQGIILSCILLAALGFEIFHILTWWNLLLLAGVGGLLELYFLNRMHIE